MEAVSDRVQQIAVLPIDTSNLESLAGNQALGEQMAQLFSDSVTVTREAGGVNPFTAASPPSDLMIAYAAGYLLLMLGLAMFWFRRRDL